jgi:hypothetical protein
MRIEGKSEDEGRSPMNTKEAHINKKAETELPETMGNPTN